MFEGLPPTDTLLGGFGLGLIAALAFILAERVMNPRLRLVIVFAAFVLCLAAIVVVVISLRVMPQAE